MASIINASTSGAGGLISTADNSGTLQLQTAGTTAMTINSSQVVNFANAPTIAGSALPTGAMTLISTQTASSSSTLSWTGLSGYNQYLLIWNDLTNPTVNGTLVARIGTGSGPTYLTSGYKSGTYGYSSGIAGSGGSASYWPIGAVTQNLSPVNGQTSGFAIFGNITGGNQTSFVCNSTGYAGSLVDVSSGGGFNTNTTTVTAIQIYETSGNIGTGSASLYGITS